MIPLTNEMLRYMTYLKACYEYLQDMYEQADMPIPHHGWYELAFIANRKPSDAVDDAVAALYHPDDFEYCNDDDDDLPF